MTVQKLRYVLELAKQVGLTTIGDLADFKKVIGIKTNYELIKCLERAAEMVMTKKVG